MSTSVEELLWWQANRGDELGEPHYEEKSQTTNTLSPNAELAYQSGLLAERWGGRTSIGNERAIQVAKLESRYREIVPRVGRSVNLSVDLPFSTPGRTVLVQKRGPSAK